MYCKSIDRYVNNIDDVMDIIGQRLGSEFREVAEQTIKEASLYEIADHNSEVEENLTEKGEIGQYIDQLEESDGINNNAAHEYYSKIRWLQRKVSMHQGRLTKEIRQFIDGMHENEAGWEY